ncbi:hypothetical protein [Streptomyces sp. NPDC054958]
MLQLFQTRRRPLNRLGYGGVCPAANHLTIVDCASDQTHLVRASLVHPRAVASVIGRPLPPT